MNERQSPVHAVVHQPAGQDMFALVVTTSRDKVLTRDDAGKIIEVWHEGPGLWPDRSLWMTRQAAEWLFTSLWCEGLRPQHVALNPEDLLKEVLAQVPVLRQMIEEERARPVRPVDLDVDQNGDY